MPSEIKIDECELVASLKSGDQQAYSYLYDHYSAALFGTILKIIYQKEKAEDVLQECFIKIYKSIHQYDPSKGRLFTWLMQIARNTAIDTLRSKEFRNDHKNLELSNNVYNQGNAGSPLASGDAIGLDKVLKVLSEDQKKIIDLAYFQGFTQEEISGKLAVPIGTVKSRARSALMQLRKLFKEI